MENIPPIIDFPVPPPGTMGPPAEFAALRAHCPVARVRMDLGATAWYVTRYQDVRELVADPRLIRPTINDWPDRSAGAEPGLITMAELDGPRHTALRRAVAEAFGAGAIRGRVPRIRGIADDLLARLRGDGEPGGDLVAGFTDPFPLLVLCDLVGIPPEERDRFLPVIEEGLSTMVTPAEADRTADLLRDYLAGLIARKRREPGRDVLSHLIGEWQAGRLSYEDLVVFGLSMLTVGFGTSAMFLANSVYALLTTPGKYARLRDDRDLLPTAVEELLRFVPLMNNFVILVATEDISLHGHTIAKDDAVLPVLAAANRDETVFTTSDGLDLGRPVNPHLAFGRGPHNCLGAHLARAQLTVGLGALLDAFPSLSLVDGQEPRWDDEAPNRTPLTLPVGW
ncbi:cytochrome P450 [Amycolatopsis samaneae]|uniref:Cytochrome P450 n=1 Tax=Amycolatopsis samaneae TaxID=664691 RepID=A0ABW5GMK0_9PSEU